VRVGWFLVLVVLGEPARVWASAEDLFGYGATAPALAGGGAATVNGYAAVHANPASLNVDRARTLTLGYEFHLFDARLDGHPRLIEPVRGAIVGVTLPIPFRGPLADRVTLGMGFFVPSQVVVRGEMLLPEEPQYLLLDSRGQSVAIQLAVGADVTPWLCLGVGFRALAELVGTVELTTDASGRLGSRVEDQLIATYAPTGGLRVHHGPWAVGLALRGELSGVIDVDVLAEDTPVPLPNLNIAGVAQYDPAQISLEGALRLRRDLVVAAGATWKHWSAYDGPIQQTTEAGPPPDNPDLRDTIVPHAGATWTVTDARPGSFTVRGGVALEPTPVPPAEEDRRHYDAARLKIGAGFGVGLGRGPVRPLSIDVFAQEQVLVPRTHEDGVESTGQIFSMGFAMGVAF
jgi:long-chain fatty acid transport protein